MEGNDDYKQESVMPNSYRSSNSTGIYGSYIYDDIKEEEEMMDYHANIQAEIERITGEPHAPRDTLFGLAKKSYKQRGETLVIDTNNTLSDIRNNAQNYRNVALPLTLAVDRPFIEWNQQQFKQDFSIKFNIPIACIRIISVRSGSQIIDLKLETHSDDSVLLISIECISDNITNKKAQQSLIEFGIFAMEFSAPTAGFSCLRQRVIMNPQWNKSYGAGFTDWNGALNDGKSRGNEPYFCPKGWKRFAIQFQEKAYDFNNVYDNWPIAYHGTKFDFSMMITLSGLKCFGGCHGTGVYLSPSIKYVSHPRYCKPVKLSLSKVKSMKEWKNKQITQTQINEFSKYDGKWVQCAFMCRVKPGSYIKAKETMSIGTDGTFDGIKKSEIEWIVHGPHGSIIGNDKILIYGLMIRAKDKQQTGYDDY